MHFDEYVNRIKQQCQELGVPEPTEVDIEFSYLNFTRLVGKAQFGDLSIAQFVQSALYQPESGYYVSGRLPFGAQGDFVTAPEISDYFGRAVARSVIPVLTECEQHLLEFGAGSGILAAQILQTLTELNYPLYRYTILEVSAPLRELQKQTISEKVPELLEKVRWITEIPAQELSACVIANEVLDAIPAHRFRKVNNDFEELCVKLGENGWQECWGPIVSPELRDWLACHGQRYDWQPGVGYEASPWRMGWLQSISQSLNKGALLFIDYGNAAQEFYARLPSSGSLRCYYRHQLNERYDYLTGLQDITSHVNFSEVCFPLEQSGWSLTGFSTQADFLLSNGLLENASVHDDLAERMKVSQEIQKLLLPGEMGELVKVIAFTRNISENARPVVPGRLVPRL